MLFIFILKLLLFVLCGIVGLALLIIIFPIRFSFSGQFTETYQRFESMISLIYAVFRLRVRFRESTLQVTGVLLGLTIVKIRKSITELGKKEAKEKPKKEEKSKPKKVNRLSSLDWLVIARRIFPRFLKPIKFRRFESDLTVGFGNPAATGFFICSYYMFKYTLNIMQKIQIKADFIRAGIFGYIELNVFIYLIQYFSILIFAYKQYRRRLLEKRGGS